MDAAHHLHRTGSAVEVLSTWLLYLHLWRIDAKHARPKLGLTAPRQETHHSTSSPVSSYTLKKNAQPFHPPTSRQAFREPLSLLSSSLVIRFHTVRNPLSKTGVQSGVYSYRWSVCGTSLCSADPAETSLPCCCLNWACGWEKWRLIPSLLYANSPLPTRS